MKSAFSSTGPKILSLVGRGDNRAMTELGFLVFENFFG